jgi:integrase
MQLNSIISAFLVSAEFSVLSKNTQKTYTYYLKKFDTLLGNKHLGSYVAGAMPNAVAMPKGVAMQNDVASLSSVVFAFNGAQAQRLSRRIFILLFSWASRYGLLADNLATRIPMPKLTAKPRSPFTVEEIKLFTNLIEDTATSPMLLPYIKQAIVAFHTGMRPSELDNLVWDDVGPEFINVRSAKANEVGAVARMVKVTDSVRSLLQNRSRGLVFKSTMGKKLNKDTRSEAIRYACKKVGIKPREFYNTRRGTATEMFKIGYDISAIQHQLGHRDIATTQIYIKPTMQQAASVFRGF